jgi:predicted MFS family arabinose efflux permease
MTGHTLGVERETNSAPAGMSRGMTLLFAVAGAAAVGNLYWAQPLLGEIATALNISLGESGTLITVTQLGYALGVLLLVPLGDSLNRGRFIPVVMGVSVLALLFSALAPSYRALIGGLAAVGLTSLSGQLLLPLAGDLARDDQRGQVIGTIASGLLIGIMLSRFISGLLADAFGWRAIYLAAAVVNLVFAVLLATKLPSDRRRVALPYGRLLTSTAGAVRSSRPVRATLAIGACAFAVFIMFWTALTFLLSSPAFSYSVTQIGLVNLVGLVGAFAAQRAGRLHDRGWSTHGTGAALALALVSLGIAAAGGTSIALVLLAVLLLNLAIQAVNVLNQTRLLTLRPELRSRLNTAFVFCNFIAGAAGSALAGVLWQAGGWLLITAGQAAIILVGLIVWTIQRGTLRAVEVRPTQGPMSAGL